MTFNGTKLPLTRFRSLGLLAMASAAGLLGGCLDRPVGQTKPETNNVFVKQNPSGGIDKIDILFQIDNSLSMGDKQAVLSAAVPQLLRRLTNPDCVSEDGATRDSTATDPLADCAAGLQREFAPVKDIHIGVVTSSLGDFGGDVCPESATDSAISGFPDQNDHGWLLGALPRVAGLGLDASGFLSWTKDNASAYGSDIGTKTTEFTNFVRATGEIGCGLEMSMESWYRFLVDPKPPTDVMQANGGYVYRGDVDNTVLSLRKAFLRSDSLVAVVMLTDENDCSLKDSRSYSWVPATSGNNFRMWRASNACAANPNDRCCFSCMMVGVDESIPADCKAADPTCKQDNASKMALADDSTGLRCKDMKRRFGFDFLFPITRYSNALTKPKICPDQTYGDLDCDCTAAKAKSKAYGYEVACAPGTPVDNPLYANLDPTVLPTGPDREDASAVFFAGIVGVPWQDLATDTSATSDLQYKLASQLTWDWFAPKDDVTPPGDPYMIESKDPRTGTHPVTGEALAPPTAARNANSINGHEWNTDNGDLEFACTFSLETPITNASTDATRNCVDVETYCTGITDPEALRKCTRQYVGCSCNKATDPATYTQNSPLCQDATGAYSTTQRSAKAYPGIRELQALRAFHEQTNFSDNAIVASICPKDLTFANQAKPGYGYNPAVAALVDRLKEKLGGTCLPRPLTVDKTTGEVPCAIVEVIQKTQNAAWCDCAAKGRDNVDTKLADAISGALKRQFICGTADSAPCSDYCFCGLKELLSGTTAGDQCLTQLNVEKSAAAPGFCYVDPSQGVGSTDIVASCPESQKRLIRIVGGDGSTPQNQAAPAPGLVFIACSGATYTGE